MSRTFCHNNCCWLGGTHPKKERLINTPTHQSDTHALTGVKRRRQQHPRRTNTRTYMCMRALAHKAFHFQLCVNEGNGVQ